MKYIVVLAFVVVAACSAQEPVKFPLQHTCSTSSDCESGHCRIEGKYCSYVCKPPPEVGSSCVLDSECLSGMRCAQQRCAAVARLNESCGQGTACEKGFDCAPDPLGNSICQAYKLRAAGEFCTQAYQCNATLACIAGRCQERKEGDACKDYTDCAKLTFCENFVCGKSADGASCDPDKQLTCVETRAGYCDTATKRCKSALPDGIPCSPTGVPCGPGMRCHRQMLICVLEGIYGPHCDGVMPGTSE